MKWSKVKYLYLITMVLMRHTSDKCGYLNVFVPVGSVVWELLESVALLEKVCYLGQPLRFLALPSFQFALSSSC